MIGLVLGNFLLAACVQFRSGNEWEWRWRSWDMELNGKCLRSKSRPIWAID
jgi:hypothetical protein